MLDIWRIHIATTDASPPAQIDAVVDTTGGGADIVLVGQLTQGVSESSHASTDVMNYFDPATFADFCTVGIKTLTLLEQSGVPAGKKIARYVLTVSPSGYMSDPKKGIVTTTSTVAGRVRYDIYDITDTLTSSVNATFTGGSISGIVFANDGDPFWSLSQ